MRHRPRESQPRKRVFEAEAKEAEDEVERLEIGDGEDGAVEVVG